MKKADAFAYQNYPFARFTTVMRQVVARSWRDNPAPIEVRTGMSMGHPSQPELAAETA